MNMNEATDSADPIKKPMAMLSLFDQIKAKRGISISSEGSNSSGCTDDSVSKVGSNEDENYSAPPRIAPQINFLDAIKNRRIE